MLCREKWCKVFLTSCGCDIQTSLRDKGYQAIQDLDSAAATTVLADHESSLVKGAAGHCALSRTVDLIEVAGTDLYAIGLLGTWGRAKEREWYTFLETLRKQVARRGVPWGQGWKLDKWDGRS